MCSTQCKVGHTKEQQKWIK